MRFDVLADGSRRINGVRNFRQALASPHPAVRFTIRRGPRLRRIALWIENHFARVAIAVALAVVDVRRARFRCATRDIADLADHPGRYQDHTVTVNGVVTSSWGLPLVPFRFYKVDDGTGEVTVLSDGAGCRRRANACGSEGRVEQVAQLGGRPLGLHLRERDLIREVRR